MNTPKRPILLKIACLELAGSIVLGLAATAPAAIELLPKTFKLFEYATKDSSHQGAAIAVMHVWALVLVLLLINFGLCVVLRGLWGGKNWAWFNGFAILTVSLIGGTIVSSEAMSLDASGFFILELSLHLLFTAIQFLSYKSRMFCKINELSSASSVKMIAMLLLVYSLIFVLLCKWMAHILVVVNNIEPLMGQGG